MHTCNQQKLRSSCDDDRLTVVVDRRTIGEDVQGKWLFPMLDSGSIVNKQNPNVITGYLSLMIWIASSMFSTGTIGKIGPIEPKGVC